MVDTRSTKRSKAVAPPPIKSKEDEKESARELRARRRRMCLPADYAKEVYSAENIADMPKSHDLVVGVIDPDGPQYVGIRGESESPEIIVVAPLSPQSRAKAAASKIADSAKMSTLNPSNVLWKPNLPAIAYLPTRPTGPTPGAPRPAASGFIGGKVFKASQIGLASTRERRGATSATSASSVIPQYFATTSAPVTVTRSTSFTLTDRTKPKEAKESKSKMPK
ncbi:hypothetical protein LZ554_009232 [Drepanopeziza brunnea f. sp. 'monogermtubi']|nr:hypothetical protein LZ554_009232 [Drepanopeziza brunnea f. sp. 'monogermtubi']